ncbi:protein-L-histidine N-pros-methyltransferase-like [Xenia sp. Carnegie-2017]|uniref:protein-L-histidine N-pros-methyltransferase-like n=1 Tax=Xenia sp. Carnegie-2017 TaxID=2897299 RepID=UPI001F044767|nr:protein-L-histidine N-pros-methyltransferase-like [Xenia sp. Carnegie-2017]
MNFILFCVLLSSTVGLDAFTLHEMFATRYSRTVMGKMLHENLKAINSDPIDITQWYAVNMSLFNQDVLEKFIQFDVDEESQEFLENCNDKTNYVFTQMAHTVIKNVLRFFISVTTINGILNRGSMFVFSNAQFRKLMNIPEGWKATSLLDLGAGDGKVTKMMANHFEKIYATEQSPSMRWRHANELQVLEIDDWMSRTYDVISCLNLLDRCDKPLTLLENIRQSLNENRGRLIVAVVLPFKPCVESGTKIIKPSERIPVKGKHWEEQLQSFIYDVFIPAGFIVEAVSRLPYLCEGDMHKDFYVLSDAIFVLRPHL